MIRSSCHSIKFSNKKKKELIYNFINNYKQMVEKFINIVWNKNTKTAMLPSSICNSIKTNRTFDSRLRQAAAKQACSIVNGTLKKRNKQLYQLKKMQIEGKETKYLQRKIDSIQINKPKIKDINIELDQRFLDIKETKNGEFNIFIRLSSIGNKEEIKIPIKHNKVSNKWTNKGNLKLSIRLNKNNIYLFYEVPEREKKQEGRVVGADQGIKTCLTFSDKQITKYNKHGYDLDKITNILSRRKKGSKGFKKTQSHRKNYINWSINQLNFSDIKEVRLEKLYEMRKYKKSSRLLSHFTYPLIKEKLFSLSQSEGFTLTEQENRFRSQRCSNCGYVHKSNRLLKEFKCKNCLFKMDSDLNSAMNNEIDLFEIPEMVWQQKLNRKGFFWLSDSIIVDEKRIVSHAI